MIEQYDNTKSYDNREKMPIFNPIGGSYGVFPVTDKCERSATLMGDDYVKLAFEADERVLFEAFSFIVYDGKHYFLKEKYRPTPKGTYYDYAMTFVSAANMLSKSVFMRYYQVSGQTIQPEPEVNVNANLSDMVAMVVRSIVGASSRVPKFNNTSGVATTTVYANMIAALTLSTEDLFDGSELKTFSYESSNIEDVLTQIANDYDTEWWLTETNGALKLHVCKCEEMVSGDGGGLVPATPSVLSDTFKYEDGKAVPYSSRGLLSVAYAQEWSNIPQRILPFGSDRNIVRKQAVDNLNDKEVYVSYGKRLRLTPGHTYTVKNKAGEDVSLVVGSYGEVTNESVTTGIEKTEVFDDIYPQGHYIVTKCELSSNGNYYTIEAQAVVQNADGTPQKEGNFYKLYSVQEANTPIGQTVVVDGVTKNGLGLVPILNKEQTEDLTIRFESGFLNGREFGVSRNNGEMVEIDGVLYAKLSLDIVPDGNDDEALSLPNETWHPQARTGVAEGDMFAIFNMDMPEAYVTMAEQRLAQAVYDKLQEYQASRPDVKCKSEPTYFEGLPTIKLGKRYSVFSELFGEVVYIDGDPDKGIDETQSTVFTSRVTAYSHSLTTPTTLEFTLASGRVAGRLADIEAMISDSSTELRGLEQRHINLSKRGWHDAYEITQMVDSLTTESMLVGNAKYQFQYTFGIVLDNSQTINSRKRTASVTLTGGGCIQHTQKPYIDYANQGIWYVDETEIDLYTSGGVANYDPTKAYYLYAKVNNTGARLTNEDIVLTETAQNGDMYMLLGILSSEFEDTDAQGNPTSFRVFSRTNGYSQINGGTITTEQIQDANRQLIIDFQHNPPRIVAVNGAEVFGNIRFKSIVDEKNRSVFGYENLLPAPKEIEIEHSTTIGSITGELEGKTFTFTCKVENFDYETDDDPWGEFYLNFHAKVLDTNNVEHDVYLPSFEIEDNGEYKKTFNTSDFLTSYPGGTVKSIIVSAVVSKTYADWFRCKMVDTMVVEGSSVPGVYYPCVKHLSEAFEQEAKALDTTINGGLIVSALLQLMNQQRQVTAGMSGLTGDNVLQWGGATYAQAINAALHDYYMSGNAGELIPYLIKKDGTGKIGCFRVVDKDTVKVVSGEKTIIITNKGIDDVATVHESHTGFLYGGYSVNGGYGQNDVVRKEDYDIAKLSFTVQKGTFNIKIPVMQIEAGCSATSYPSSSAYEGQHDDGWGEGWWSYDLRVEIRNNGSIIYSTSYKSDEGRVETDNGTGTPVHGPGTDLYFAAIDQNFDLEAGSLEIVIFGDITVGIDTQDDDRDHAGSHADASVDCGNVYVNVTNIDKFVVVAKDGFAVIANSNASFYIRNTETDLTLIAKGLPTSNPNVKGQLYAKSDDHILRVSVG